MFFEFFWFERLLLIFLQKTLLLCKDCWISCNGITNVAAQLYKNPPQRRPFWRRSQVGSGGDWILLSSLPLHRRTLGASLCTQGPAFYSLDFSGFLHFSKPGCEPCNRPPSLFELTVRGRIERQYKSKPNQMKSNQDQIINDRLLSWRSWRRPTVGSTTSVDSHADSSSFWSNLFHQPHRFLLFLWKSFFPQIWYYSGRWKEIRGERGRKSETAWCWVKKTNKIFLEWV